MKKSAEDINMGDKKCNRCGTSNIKFKFFNNKKADQPRYQCLDCTSVTGKPYFFNPNPKRQHHKDGYAKLPKEETEELKNLEKVCDKCHAVNNVKFRGYNNGNMNQPRYVCKGCNQLFSPLKKSKAVRVVETKPSNQVHTQPATSEALHRQQRASLQQPIPPEFQPPLLQTLVQINNNYQRTIQQQQIALENQQPHLQTLIHNYHSNQRPTLQQQTPTGIIQPPFQINQTTIQQQQNAPRFHQPYHQPLVHNNHHANQSIFHQPQLRTGLQQPHSHPSFQSNHRNQTTIHQQQTAPRNQQPHHQTRISHNYYDQRILLQQQIPTELQQRHPKPSVQIHINQATYLVPVVQIPSANQQTPIQPASQSSSNHPDAQISEELGIWNQQDSPTTSFPANCSTASPLTHQSSVPFSPDIAEEYKNNEFIFDDVYFKGMMNSNS